MSTRLHSLFAAALATACLTCSSTYKPKITPSSGSHPAAARCPATTVESKSYSDTIDKSVPDDVGSTECVSNPAKSLRADVDCARSFNEEQQNIALKQAGLTKVERRTEMQETFDRDRGVEAQTSAESADGEERMILAQSSSSGCSPLKTLVGNDTAFLAQDQTGKLWRVVPKPNYERRQYMSCSCFSGCGVEKPTTSYFWRLEEGETYGGDKALAYPALQITSRDVDRHNACGYAP